MILWPRLRRQLLLRSLAASLLAPLAACDGQARPLGGPSVGVSEFLLEGGPDIGAMPAVAWYPAHPAAPEVSLRYESVFLGRAAPDAPLLPHAGPRPLVLLSHGLRGTRYDLSWLGERLAQAGYVAVAIAHPGVGASDYDRVAAVQVWRRARQLSAALDALVHHPTLGPQIDTAHACAVGHSAGGSAVLALGGAVVDPQRFARRYPASGPVPPADYGDARLVAAVGLAPGTGRVFADAGLHTVHAQTLLVSGDKDWLTPEADNAARYAAEVPGARWERLPGTGHYVFKPRCSLYGRLRARAICTDASGVNRAEVHEQVTRAVRLFLAKALRHAGAGGPAATSGAQPDEAPMEIEPRSTP